MARIRYMHPEFFIDDDLAKLNYAIRLFFAGLWCHADKEGRLEYKPDKLKVLIMPYDKISPVKFLETLSNSKNGTGYIKIYEIDGKRYIQIQSWNKYQHPHHTEKESLIPAYNSDLTVNEPLSNGVITPNLLDTPLSLSSSLSLPLIAYGSHVKLKEDTYKLLCNEYGKQKIDDTINNMNDYISMHGKKPYKDYAAAIRAWIRKDLKEGKSGKKTW